METSGGCASQQVEKVEGVTDAGLCNYKAASVQALVLSVGGICTMQFFSLNLENNPQMLYTKRAVAN